MIKETIGMIEKRKEKNKKHKKKLFQCRKAIFPIIFTTASKIVEPTLESDH